MLYGGYFPAHVSGGPHGAQLSLPQDTRRPHAGSPVSAVGGSPFLRGG